jgi:predicted ribosomally synthesized peptide with SipW-like signal peptide
LKLNKTRRGVIKMRRILTSLLVVGVAATAVIGATQAFFNDTETSTGNVLKAGAIDLRIDSQAHYAGLVCDIETGKWVDEDGSDNNTRPELLGQDCEGSWVLKDLVQGDRFFNLLDLKPGDEGENTISIHVDSNDAYMCAIIDNMQNDDNGLTEPESDVDSTGGIGEGELADEVHFFAWNDNGADEHAGNNIWDEDEDPLFSNVEGPASDVIDGVVYPLTQIGNPIPGGETQYIGLYWCYGELTVEANSLSCDGASATNLTQTDSLAVDISFFAEQARNNDQFACPSIEQWRQDHQTQRQKVGALLSAYQPPVCDDVVQPGSSIQEVINGEDSGPVICLADGEHTSDTYPLVLDVPNMTLAGESGPLNSAELDGGVRIEADNVTVTGLVLGVTTGQVGVDDYGVYLASGATNATVSYNIIEGLETSSGRGILNITGGTISGGLFHNNQISNWLTGIFMNPSTQMIAEYNDVFGNGVGFGNDGPVNNTLRYNDIQDNSIEGVGYSEAGAVGTPELHVNFNNIVDNGGTDVNEYGASPTLDAENNWWGDLDPSNDVSGDVDYTPSETSAFPEN